MVDKLEDAQFDPSELAIAITSEMEEKLKLELQATCNLYVQSVHHAEFLGWRIIVKGKQ